MTKYFLICYVLVTLQQFTSQISPDNCSTNDGKLDCSKNEVADISTLPNINLNATWLDLSHNNITTLVSGTFLNMSRLKILDLSYNNIRQLDIDSFLGLDQLMVLDISNNTLIMPFSFPLGVFKPLTSLEVLKMQGTVNRGTYPHLALQDLTSLKELYMQGTNGNFGIGFTRLTNLTRLFLGAPTCTMKHLSNETFSNLKYSNLEELSIQSCHGLSSIELDTFEHFIELKTLNMACNLILNRTEVLNAVFAIPLQPTETVVLDGISSRIELDGIKETAFTKSAICTGGNLPNLKRLSIRHTRLQNLSFDVLHCMPNLEVLNIGFNPMTSITAPWKIFTDETKKYWMDSNITELDWSYGFSPFETAFLLEYCPGNIQPTSHYFKNYQLKYGDDLEDVETPDVQLPDAFEMKLNNKTQILHFDHLNTILPSPFSLFCLFHFSPNNDIRFMNASFNRFGDLTCEMIGLHHVQEIDLSYCGLKTVSKRTFKSTPNLRKIILTGNELGTNDQQFNNSLEFLTKLGSIVLSNNKLKHLPKKAFASVKLISDIDLSNNSLSEIQLDLNDNVNLKTLDISFNLLPSLSSQFMRNLKRRQKNTTTLVINLLGNPFQCNCKSIQFLKFVNSAENYNIQFEHLKQYSCSHNNASVRIIEVNIESLESSCEERDYYAVIIGTSVTVVVLEILSAILVYRCRWKIAWKVYEMRRFVRQARYRRSFSHPVHKYKLFVAYATLDDVGLPWVRHELLPCIEDKWGMKAFILDRDALVGPFLEEVTNGIKHSEKKLFVVTPYFLRYYQWPMVLHWCVDSGISSLIIVLIDMKVRNLPPSLAHVAMVLEKRYPTHVLHYKTGSDDTELWNNLKIALDEPDLKRVRDTVL